MLRARGQRQVFRLLLLLLIQSVVQERGFEWQAERTLFLVLLLSVIHEDQTAKCSHSVDEGAAENRGGYHPRDQSILIVVGV